MIRKATSEDYLEFQRLWQSFMVDLQLEGTHIRVTGRTLSTYNETFLSYVEGKLPGVVIVSHQEPRVGTAMVSSWADTEGPGRTLNGILLVGAAMPFGTESVQTDLDPIAHGWGLYVAPEVRKMGVSNEMLAMALPLLREQGFKTVALGIPWEQRDRFKPWLRFGAEIMEISVIGNLENAERELEGLTRILGEKEMQSVQGDPDPLREADA